VRVLGSVLLAGLMVLFTAFAASAAEGRIDHVQKSTAGGLEVLYSIPGTAPDFGSVRASLDKQPVKATATLASDSQQTVHRVTVLTIDVSHSMLRNGKFAAAKQAAQVFLESAPSDVYVGIVTFAGQVKVVQQPTLDRASSLRLIRGLSVSTGTRLYDGIEQAVKLTGASGGRSVVVLSDGRDTTGTKLSEVVPQVRASGVKVDVVAFAQSDSDARLLAEIPSSGGKVIPADDPAALSRVFAAEAKTLAEQILVRVTTPAKLRGTEGTLSISIDAGTETYTDEAFVTVPGKLVVNGLSSAGPLPVQQSGPRVPRNLVLGAIVAMGVALLVLVVAVFGTFKKRPEDISTRLDAYTRSSQDSNASSPAGSQGMAAQAVGMTAKALKSNKRLEAKLGVLLDAAGVSLKPAEWILLHASIAFTSGAVGFLLGSGSAPLIVLMLLVGAVTPALYLRIKRARRLSAFNGQLAETLQLMAGSLQAGLSMAQSIDTVVREGVAPVAEEFRRALVETRLGVPIEEALESVAERMESADFKWTVMAIGIQRDVGGNLAELLLSVAATLRERDYLRRQVKSLSAEGRFSAYILLALPPIVAIFMAFTNRAYLQPLFSDPRGWVMVVGMVMLMGLGALTMNKMIKVDV